MKRSGFASLQLTKLLVNRTKRREVIQSLVKNTKEVIITELKRTTRIDWICVDCKRRETRNTVPLNTHMSKFIYNTLFLEKLIYFEVFF